MEKLESTIQHEIIVYLERCGWYVIKILQCNKNGAPDLMAIREGKTIFVECKRKGQKARPLQEYRIQELINHGVVAVVAHSIEEVKTVIEQIKSNQNEKTN
jgi:Holliday junction resolvase